MCCLGKLSPLSLSLQFQNLRFAGEGKGIGEIDFLPNLVFGLCSFKVITFISISLWSLRRPHCYMTLKKKLRPCLRFDYLWHSYETGNTKPHETTSYYKKNKLCTFFMEKFMVLCSFVLDFIEMPWKMMVSCRFPVPLCAVLPK